jgi:hypothetical protein
MSGKPHVLQTGSVSVCSVQWKMLTSVTGTGICVSSPHLKMETDLISETLSFLVTWRNSINGVVLSVVFRSPMWPTIFSNTHLYKCIVLQSSCLLMAVISDCIENETESTETNVTLRGYFYLNLVQRLHQTEDHEIKLCNGK